jgi:hypothetical protein
MADEVEVTRDVPPRYPARPATLISDMFNRVSWGAIWAGVMVALGMETLFTLFGLFIGFDMYNPTAANPWAGVSIWSMAWYLVTAGWSMFFGAWCAARLSGVPLRRFAVLHGITTWGLATFATLLVVTSSVWAVLRASIALLVTGAAAPVAGAAAAPTPAATAGTLARIAGILWGGIMLGLITAIIGGLLGKPRMTAGEVQEAPGGPSRLAA